MKTVRCGHALSLLIPLLAALAATPTKAQPITPANDATGTTINQNGNQFNIQGGTRSGANLFHSFDQFNLNSGETANFLTTPDTTNILGRITGGNASYVNGLIQVIGSNSNLFLMNPAGIMFGPNATLNIPASFSVTTATGIGFDNNNFWFKAMGTNDYSKLVGNPSGYRFNVSTPGAIVNEANLSLNPGENLTLLGGSVINTGELSVSGGNITIASVEGGSTLRISQPGHLLSLDVETLHATSLQDGEDTNITALSLPELLTGGNITHASSVTVNADGDVVLTDSNTLIADTPGTTITSGSINVSIPPNPPYEGGDTGNIPLDKGDGRGIRGQINVLGDRVALIDTNINADGLNGGGTVLIGGDFQGNGIVPNSEHTFVNQNSIISADAITNGDGGRVIIWSDEITNFGGNISAKGGEISGNGGFVEVSGKQQLIFDGTVDVSAAFGNTGTILLDPENLTVGELENTLGNEEGNNSEIEFTENTENSETETAQNNSEVQPNENSDSDTTENNNNSEIEIADSTNTENTDITDNSETTETETPIDPFAQDENADVTISAENIEDLSGEIILQADNDITVNEKIETDSNVEIKAGRSININADIETSSGNGNITLFGNDNNANVENRREGLASINQQEGTTLNAGSGTIAIRLGALGEIGDINLANLTTEGRIILNANSGNITQVSPNSLITAEKAILRTRGAGGIGLSDAPLRFDVNNLEALTGKGGVFIDSISSLTVGGVNGQLTGISTGGRRGRIQLNVDGDINIEEGIESAHNVRLTASESVNINADINTENGDGNIFIEGNNGEGKGDIIQAEGTNLEAGSGTIRIELGNVEEIGDITLGNLTTTGGVLVNANGGNIESVDENSLINAGNIVLETSGNGGIGLSDLPLRLDVEKLEAVAGSGGVFFDVLGDVNVAGISTVDGGDIELLAENKITVVEEIYTKVNEGDAGDAGDISIESRNGGIDTKESEINASSELGNGGSITLTAERNIQTNKINAEATETGGDIILNAGNSINTTKGLISSSSNKEGGNIEITAGENIQTSSLRADGTETGGNIILHSGNSLDTNGLVSSSSDQKSGNIELTAGENITTELISSVSFGTFPEDEENNARGGDITLKAGGIIDTTKNQIQSAAFDGDGGNITLKAEGDIFTQRLLSSVVSGDHQGGNITLESGRNINTSKGKLESVSLSERGGNISLKAAGNIITGSLYSYTPYGERGGNVTISAGGIIDSTGGAIESYSNLSNGGNRGIGGNVSINATDSVITGNITTFGGEKGGEIEITSSSGSIDTSPGGLNSSAGKGTGANIILSAESNIYTGNVNSSGMEKGGDIQLSSNSGDVNTNEGELTAFSENGTDGNISINAYEGSIEVGDLDISTNITIADGTEEDINENSNNIDAEEINDTEGEVTLQAHNDITINEPINSDKISNLEIKAGRNININADIDTSGANGNITLSANDNNANANYREPGKANITMAADTTLDAGSGNITIQMGTLGEFGDITLSNLRTAGTVTVDTPGGNIFRASDNSLIKAESVIFQTRNDGGIGLSTQPIRLEVNKLEARGGSGGAFFNSPTQEISIGDASDAIRGILTSSGGDVEISAEGDITVTEPISTFTNNGKAGNITLNSSGIIDTSSIQLISRSYDAAGNITLNAESDIKTANVDSRSFGSGDAGDITLEAGGKIDTSGGTLESNSMFSNGGDITLEAQGNIYTSVLSSATGFLSDEPSKAGDINITSMDGNINTETIFSNAFKGVGGNINLNSAGNIEIYNIASFGSQQSGDVNIQSNNGTITTRNIQTIAENGTSGNIRLNTYNFQGNINTADIQSVGDRSSGEVEVIASDGSITTENIESLSNSGNSDDITVQAKDDVNTDEINSTGGENSGDIEVSSDDGEVNTGNIESHGDSGDSGNIDVDAENNINTENISTSGNNNSGDIEVSSDNGNVNTGNIESRGDSGDSGNIDVDAENNINTENISTYANNNSGDIEVNSNNGSIYTQNVVTEAETGDAGDIDIAAQDNINTDNIGSFGGDDSGTISVSSDQGSVNANNIETIAETGNSGDINVTAREDINTDNITSIGGEDSGNISVTSIFGSVNTENIISKAETGSAGNIDISARNNINTGNITSTGPQGSGNINLTTRIGEISTGEILTDTGIVNINQPNNNISLPAPNNLFPIVPPFPVVPPLNTSAINEIPASIMIDRTPQIPTNLPLPPTKNLTLPSTTTTNNPRQTNNFFSTINSNQNPSSITANISPSTIISNLPNINNNLKLNSEIYSTYIRNTNQFFPSNTSNINIPESMLIHDKIAKTMMLYNFFKDDEDIINYLYNENMINYPQILLQSQISSRTSLTVDITRQEMISGLEKSRIDEYSSYFGVNLEPQLLSTKSARDILAEMEQQTGKKSAVIYVNVYNDKLQLILFTADGQSILKTIYEVNRAKLKEIALQFHVNIIDPRNRNSQSYLPLAQKLYNWLISPMASELEAANIDTLLLSMDSGFRLLPVAALHDGKQFLIEKYNISLIPSLSLMNSNYNSLKNTQVLAMGASQFSDKPSLPAVPVELTSITENLWQGDTFLNEEFTRKNLINQRQNYPYPIIHLATHAEFKSGDVSKSYIQLWDEKLQLDKIRELGWNNPEVELLVLSACRTAVGDQNAELGFAGLAIATGVKSALGSFWLVNDEATLGLMTEFYSHLGNVKIKAEALREAQVAMLRGEVAIADGKLRGSGSPGEVALPPELASIQNKNFAHPYYWAGFTMVGSPW
ncbi:CHAT domain-containing protein [Dapis sp. BLCC M126]|uniref:CHAT domain-containing protein n=1 Tax=Dapis sp. BLCC M126 TaxID=3400189 RepID=UPI003CF84597